MFDFNRDPAQIFDELLKEAELKKVQDANAMALSTVDEQGKPTSRVVLYKGMVRGGFSFYTNYGGKKSLDLKKNPHASVVFFWPALEQQIRIEGKVEKLTRAESEAYFATRPRLSQIGAWASQQSQKIANTQVFLDNVEKFEKRFAGQDVPCPENWGGFHLIPEYYEFWFGRQGRLHERFVFEKHGQSWATYQLSP